MEKDMAEGLILQFDIARIFFAEKKRQYCCITQGHYRAQAGRKGERFHLQNIRSSSFCSES